MAPSRRESGIGPCASDGRQRCSAAPALGKRLPATGIAPPQEPLKTGIVLADVVPSPGLSQGLRWHRLNTDAVGQRLRTGGDRRVVVRKEHPVAHGPGGTVVGIIVRCHAAAPHHPCRYVDLIPTWRPHHRLPRKHVTQLIRFQIRQPAQFIGSGHDIDNTVKFPVGNRLAPFPTSVCDNPGGQKRYRGIKDEEVAGAKHTRRVLVSPLGLEDHRLPLGQDRPVSPQHRPFQRMIRILYQALHHLPCGGQSHGVDLAVLRRHLGHQGLARRRIGQVLQIPQDETHRSGLRVKVVADPQVELRFDDEPHGRLRPQGRIPGFRPLVQQAASRLRGRCLGLLTDRQRRQVAVIDTVQNPCASSKQVFLPVRQYVLAQRRLPRRADDGEPRAVTPPQPVNPAGTLSQGTSGGELSHHMGQVQVDPDLDGLGCYEDVHALCP